MTTFPHRHAISRGRNSLYLIAVVIYFINHSAQAGPTPKERYGQPPGMRSDTNSTSFPLGFLFGVGSSAYQVEGAWDEDGKGESEIDYYARNNPKWTVDGSNGDVACDSYHQYNIDTELVKNLGADFYRFSISWPRILPTGDPTNINQNGIDYYNKLIDGLIANGLKPMVTIYHWDMPQKLIELGGWTNQIISDYYEAYARILFTNFGDRVQWWVTLNEPQLMAVFGYGQGLSFLPTQPPGHNLTGVADYLAVHNFLISHARVYHMYQTHFKGHQKGNLGIAANMFSYMPVNDTKEANDAAERLFEFEAGWILHPILSPDGDYPPIMRERVDRNSKKEGRSKSRLPHFTQYEIEFLKGTLDYVGVNYYTQFLARNSEVGLNPSSARDSGSQMYTDPKSMVPGVAWLAHEPTGLRRVLNWIKCHYGNPPVFITENGCDDPGGLNDTIRISYHRDHFKELLKAIHQDGCKVIGYSAWSLLDSFEWTSGYTAKFGLYHVDFSDPKRKRTPKESVKFFQDVFLKRCLNSS